MSKEHQSYSGGIVGEPSADKVAFHYAGMRVGLLSLHPDAKNIREVAPFVDVNADGETVTMLTLKYTVERDEL